VSRVDEELIREIERLLTKLQVRNRLLLTLRLLGINWPVEEDDE
jgi:hypothetical protein